MEEPRGTPGVKIRKNMSSFSSTVVTKNRTNERQERARLNVAHVLAYVLFHALSAPLAPPFSPSRMDTGAPSLSLPRVSRLSLFFFSPLLRAAPTASASPPPMQQSLCAAHPGVLSSETMIS